MSDPFTPVNVDAVVSATGSLLRAVRAGPPLTQCITNSVVTNFTANALLAVGASAAMTDMVGEAGPFARIASGLLINVGTPTPEQREASIEAAEAASDAATPWVLDPVAVGTLPVRTSLARQLAAMRPTAIKGNASEILGLAGMGAGGRGVDAVDGPDAALEAALQLAHQHGSVVAVTGPVDLITDGSQVLRIANGHALLTQITGGGCALGAITAAFLGAARGSGEAPIAAVAAASIVFEVAAERAASAAAGPGSFAVALLDALAALTPEEAAAAARVEWAEV